MGKSRQYHKIERRNVKKILYSLKFIYIFVSNTLQVEISEKDIQNAFLPLHTIVFIVNKKSNFSKNPFFKFFLKKTMVSRWRKRSLSRSQSPNNNNNSEANSPM